MGLRISRVYDDELAMLKQKLAETSLLLKVLAKVNTLIPESKSFESFCSEVSRILQDEFRFTYLHIWIRDDENSEKLRLVTPEYAGKVRETTVRQGIIGKAFRENRTICLPNVRNDPDYLGVHIEVESELCIPLRYKGKVFGAFNIETKEPQDFANQLQILELIASNLSHSLHLALLTKTEEYFHNLVDHMSEGVWVGDSKEQTVYSNPALQRMLGLTAQELTQKRSYDFFDEASRAIIREENKKREQNESSDYEAVILNKNGTTIPVLVHGVPFGKGGSMGTFTDLRAIKEAERKLFRTERFLASITQYCIEAIIGIGKDETIQSWNMGACRMLGFEADQVIGKPIGMIIPEDRKEAGEMGQIIDEARNKGFVRNFETTCVRKNGKTIIVSVSVSSVKDEHGKIIGFSALMSDITAQKKWERELQDRFEKMQEAYKEMGRQRRYLDYLIEMLDMAVARGQNKKYICTFIVNAMNMISRADAVTLRLFDTVNGKLVLAAQSGLGEEWWSKKAIRYQGSLLEAAVKAGHSLKVLDILNDGRYTSPTLARKHNLRSALIIPLMVKEELLGSLSLYLTQDNTLGMLDDEFIGAFAKQSALAIKMS